MTAPNAAALTKVALLIDGDNVSATFMPIIIREAEKIGAIAVRRIYGQFKSGRMKSWEKPIALYELTPVNVSPLTHGKNATDMKLVIEAMDMLYGRQLDALCIASSDGDFTPLAARIRGNAIAVYGFGAKKAPAGYKAEFDRFFECDTMLAAEKKTATPRKAPATATPAARAPARSRPAAEKPAPRTASPSTGRDAPASNSGARKAPAAAPAAAAPAAPAPAARKATRAFTPEVEKAILMAVERASRTEGRATLRSVGNALARAIPDFHARDYGYANTKALMQGLSASIEIIKEDGETYIRLKSA